MNLIYQYYHGDMTDTIKTCTDSMKAYAFRTGSSYLLNTGSVWYGNELSRNVKALDGFANPAYEHYENILVIDCDIIPRRNLEDNIFDYHGHCAAVDRGETERMKSKRKTRGWKYYEDSMFTNGGLFKIGGDELKRAREVLWELEDLYLQERGPNHHEEDLMNWVWHHANIPARDLGVSWNYSTKAREELPRNQARFHHLVYNGTKEDSLRAIEDLV